MRAVGGCSVLRVGLGYRVRVVDCMGHPVNTSSLLTQVRRINMSANVDLPNGKYTPCCIKLTFFRSVIVHGIFAGLGG